MECYSKLIVDLDGVVWRGGAPIMDNVEPLSSLLAGGAKIVFLTNNSTRTRERYAEILSRLLGAPVRPEDVVTSGYSASEWLRKSRGCARVLVVGEHGLVSELSRACHKPLTPPDWRDADAVVVGLDRGVCYRGLAAAHRAILGGALFIATNTDRNFPVEEGTEPGAGAIVALLRESTGREPDFDAGKPGGWILELALEKLGGGPALVVGDRVDTDMEMARRHGLPGLLVLTGVTRSPPRGSWFRVVRSLSEAVVDGGRICLGPQ
ncbi:MAG: HAD-IIA family hydrolase [Desulfurococcales archaeon]|nr:HAD-IIA family hydrolase [Desulfurococcales archaeon]